MRYVHFHVYFSVSHNSQDTEATPVSINRWMDKANIIYAHNGILSAFTKKEILQHVTTWMNLEDITLTEISQSQKDTYTWFYLYEISKLVRLTEIKSGMVVARDLGEGKMMGCYSTAIVSFYCFWLRRVLVAARGIFLVTNGASFYLWHAHFLSLVVTHRLQGARAL